VSARVSRLLGNGSAPARAFGGGGAMVATAGPSGVECQHEMPGGHVGEPRLCTLSFGHRGDWHEAGGWRWKATGEAERLPRVGR
jgi:hypothetical protein